MFIILIYYFKDWDIVLFQSKIKDIFSYFTMLWVLIRMISEYITNLSFNKVPVIMQQTTFWNIFMPLTTHSPPPPPHTHTHTHPPSQFAWCWGTSVFRLCIHAHVRTLFHTYVGDPVRLGLGRFQGSYHCSNLKFGMRIYICERNRTIQESGRKDPYVIVHLLWT